VGNRKVYSSNSAGKEMQLPLSANCGPVIAGAGKLEMKEQEMVKEAAVQEV